MITNIEKHTTNMRTTIYFAWLLSWRKAADTWIFRKLCQVLLIYLWNEMSRLMFRPLWHRHFQSTAMLRKLHWGKSKFSGDEEKVNSPHLNYTTMPYSPSWPQRRRHNVLCWSDIQIQFRLNQNTMNSSSNQIIFFLFVVFWWRRNFDMLSPGPSTFFSVNRQFK